MKQVLKFLASATQALLRLLAAAVMIMSFGLCAPASAQVMGWPQKPITLVVPFPPGGVADTVARPVAEVLARELKTTVVVENRVGAGGAMGIGSVARAPADGYTLLMALSSISILPEADKILGRKPSFTLDQFTPIARFTADPTVLVVRADSPWNNLDDFLKALKSQPGKYNYGSSGNYGTMHVPMEMLKGSAKVHMTHIPYTGAGPAVLALLGGQLDALSTGPASVLQHIKSGKLKALAHWGEAPLAALPGVPSLKQAGHPVSFAQWSALFVAAGTPQALVVRLRELAKLAAQDAQVLAVINRAGSPVEYQDADEFQRYWNADAQRMVLAVKRIGKVE